MKKTIVLFVLIALVLITSGMWFFNSNNGFNLKELSPFLVLIVVIGFALFIGIKRISSFKRGEPIEDELSKKILVKAASVSYYISIYLWLIIMYYSDKTTLENHTLIGTGILGMAIIFAVTWLVIQFRGVKNE